MPEYLVANKINIRQLLMKTFLIQISIALTVLLVACGSGGNGNAIDPLSSDKLSEFQSCAVDSDCVVAQNGCCDCANGGQDVAVNKDELDDFQSSFNCAAVLCTALGAIPPCGSGTTKCDLGKCTFIPPEGR